MNFWQRSALVLAMLFLLGGCASTGVSERHRFDENSSNGLVFAAILYQGVYSANVVYVRSMDGKIEKTLRFGEAVLAWPVPPRGDYAEEGYASLGSKGALIAEELPPGDYEVYRWSVTGSAGTVRSVEPFSAQFSVEPGVATYLGAYEFHHRKAALVITSASMKIHDEFERDRRVFEEKFKQAKPREISNGIARYTRVMPMREDTPPDVPDQADVNPL